MKLLHRCIVFAIVIVSFVVQTKAQDDQTALSSVSTVDQLNVLFTKMGAGEKDPFEVVPLIAASGNKVLPALQTVLAGKPDTVDAPTYQRNSNYAVLILEAIGTTKACSVLVQTATQHSDVEVRAHALNTIAHVYFQYAQEKRFVPDGSIIKLLALNADDTTEVNSLQKSIGKIAREGLLNWTGEDWGNLSTAEQAGKVDSVQYQGTIIETKEQTISEIAATHQQWWQKNQDRFKWNDLLGRFAIQ